MASVFPCFPAFPISSDLHMHNTHAQIVIAIDRHNTKWIVGTRLIYLSALW